MPPAPMIRSLIVTLLRRVCMRGVRADRPRDGRAACASIARKPRVARSWGREPPGGREPATGGDAPLERYGVLDSATQETGRQPIIDAGDPILVASCSIPT